MRKVILFIATAFAAIVFSAASLQAAVETIKVSGDITTQAVLRNNLDLGGGSHLTESSFALNTEDNDDSFFMTQVRLRFDADLTENVFATVGLLYEGDWGKEYEGNYTDAESRKSGKDSLLRLDIANITLKDFIQDGITAVIGRQPLRYGNALIVGDPDTNQIDDFTDRSTYANKGFTGAPDLSLRKSFDAVRVSVDMAPWKYDLFYALLAEGNYQKNDDISLYGIYGWYDVGSRNTVVEPYFIVKEGAVNAKFGYGSSSSSLIRNHQQILVPGLRVSGDVTDKLMLSLEGAYQFGKNNVDAQSATSSFSDIEGKNNQSAYAIQAIGRYQLKTKYNPVLSAAYSYFSKDWDPMAEDQSAAELINIIFPQTNAHQFMVAGSVMPREDITLSLSYTHLLLAKRLSSFYGRGTGVVYYMDDRKRNLGGEIDAKMLYDYTEDVQLSLVTGWFMPGSAFGGVNSVDSTIRNTEDAWAARVGAKVIF